MAEPVVKLCKPREHSFAKDGRKSSWSLVQKSGLRQQLEDDYFRVEEYHGSMPRYKYRIMLHRNDFYLRIAVSSDLEKLLQKYWQYFHVVLPTLIPTSVQDDKSRMSWTIQHITFMRKQERKKRLKKLAASVQNADDLDLNHLEDLEDLSEWTSDEEDSTALSSYTAEETGPRSESEITVLQLSPPKHDPLKYHVRADSKSFSDPHVGSLQNSLTWNVTSPPLDNQNDPNDNNNNSTAELQTQLTRSNSLPLHDMRSNAEEPPVMILEEKKRSKWKQFFKRKPEDPESPDEGNEEKNTEGRKLAPADLNRLNVYASIDRQQPQKSPSLFRKLKKKNEHEVEKQGISAPEMDSMSWLKVVIAELFDEDAPRDVRTSKYCILGVSFAIVYAFFLRYSSFDLFMILLIALCIGIVYVVKERRMLISMAAKRKLRKVVKQEKKKFLGWLPNSGQKEVTKEKQTDKEKDTHKDALMVKDEEREPSGSS